MTTPGDEMDDDEISAPRALLREADQLLAWVKHVGSELCQLPPGTADRAESVRDKLRELYTGPVFRRVRG